MGHVYESLEPRKHSGTHWDWILPWLGLVATSALGIALTVMNAYHWRSSENIASYVAQHRSTIAVGLQILSSVLGFLQIQALRYVFASSFSVLQIVRAFNLDTMRFVQALSTPTIAWHTRWQFTLSSALFVGFSIVPAALWSGALTPVIVEKHTSRIIHIPTFQSSNVSTLWDAGNNTDDRIYVFGDSPVWMTSDGLFTFDLTISSISATFQGLASSSSNASQTGALRAKFDSTGYRFQDRSFGVGASAGLITIPNTVSPTWYKYSEPGLRTKATCARNETSAFSIGYIFSSDVRNEFIANGSFANGFPVTQYYSQLTPRRHDIFMWAVGHAGVDDAIAANKTLISMTVGADNSTDNVYDFNQLDKVQCEVTFQATNFSVFVNTTSKTVSVTGEHDLPAPDYANAVLSKLDDPFSQYSGNDHFVFGSQFGHSIMLNINRLRQLRAGDNSNSTLFQGIEDYIESLFDNGIGMLSATRLVGTNKTTAVRAKVGLPAVSYGRSNFVYVLMAINCIIFLIFVIEAIRTRLWAGRAELDLSDVRSVMLASSEGGKALATRVHETAGAHGHRTKVQVVRLAGGNREAIVVPEPLRSKMEGRE